MSAEKSKKLIDALSQYPLTKYCFEKFINWCCLNVEGCFEEYALIDALDKNKIDCLEKCEKQLVQSREILGLSDSAFCNAFGFNDDLLTEDPEKMHDVLAETLFVVDLSNSGFTKIEKLSPCIKHGFERKSNSDFLATHGNLKFAIELKTIRKENRPKPELGKLLGDSTKSYWWGEMMRNNSETKIENKNQKVLKQLCNTSKYYDCDKKMLALYTRRLGTSALMTKDDYYEELKLLKEKYKEIDYFCIKDYFGMVCFYPEL